MRTMTGAMKRCPRCDEELPVASFGPNRSNKDGLQTYCEAHMQEFRLANRPKSRGSEVTRVRNGKTQVFRRGPNHGEARTPLWNVWKGMRARCRDENASNYRWYGARGIDVCDEWYDDYMTFRAWAVSTGYEEGFQLEREDNSLGYNPENCRWVTRLENLKNRRAYLPQELDERLRREASERGVEVYALIREAIEAYLGSTVERR